MIGRTGTWVNESRDRSGPEWPIVMLRCGCVASLREAMRENSTLAFCMTHAKWVEKV